MDIQNIIMSKDGKPFKNRAAAQGAIGSMGLDQDEHVVVPMGDAFVIAKVDKEAIMAPAEPEQEKYYWVRFHPKGSPNDEHDVVLSVNGEPLIIARQKRVCIPGRYRECCDNGMYPVFRQLPGKDRKVVAWVKHFNYDMLGDATESDFIKMKRDGTIRTKKAMEQSEEMNA